MEGNILFVTAASLHFQTNGKIAIRSICKLNLPLALAEGGGGSMNRHPFILDQKMKSSQRQVVIYFVVAPEVKPCWSTVVPGSMPTFSKCVPVPKGYGFAFIHSARIQCQGVMSVNMTQWSVWTRTN